MRFFASLATVVLAASLPACAGHAIDELDVPPPPAAGGAQSIRTEAEECDGLDNDRDGETDEGCPLALGWVSSVQHPSLGDSDQASASFVSSCANYEVLVGVNAKTGATGVAFESVQGVCRQVSLELDVASHRYAVKLGEARVLEEQPSASGGTSTGLWCPGNRAVVGARVRVRNALWLTCAELVVGPNINQAITWENAIEVGPLSGGANDPQLEESALQLESPEIATGLNGRGDAAVERFGLAAARIGTSAAASLGR